MSFGEGPNGLCELCLANREKALRQRFDFSIGRCAREQTLAAERRSLERVMNSKHYKLCENCATRFAPKATAARLRKRLSALRSRNRAKLRALAVARGTQSQTAVGAAAFEREIRTRYLRGCLIRLELRMLAENIRSVVGRNERGVLVTLMQPPISIYFASEELIELNRHRENSLFRVHKCGFKAREGFYAHNSALEPATEADGVEREIFPEFGEAPALDAEQPICHHCKYVGRRGFFRVCARRHFDVRRTDSDRHLKRLFGFDSESESRCDRTFCAYCARNFYQTLHSDETFICPYCQDRCCCPSCDARDVYVRLFGHYLALSGSRALLLAESPLQRVIQAIEKWERERRAPINDRSTIESRNSLERGREARLRLLSCLKARRALVRKLELVQLLHQREQLKREALLATLGERGL